MTQPSIDNLALSLAMVLQSGPRRALYWGSILQASASSRGTPGTHTAERLPYRTSRRVWPALSLGQAA